MNPRAKLALIRRELKDVFIERDEVVDGALVAVLARQHLLLLGPPGTAKSMLAKAVCARFGGGTYFEWLLTKFTTPEEVFGPVSLQALERGEYRRLVERKLPAADVAFLDEVFKANSAILNALLTILNERVFYNGTEALKVPLRTLVAASNEIPGEEDLAALYDRFLLRYTVGYIEQDFRFAKMLRMDEEVGPGTVLDKAEVEQLADAAAALAVPDVVLHDLMDVRRTLVQGEVVASDRRFRQALGALKAHALLEGRDEVGEADLGILEHILWNDPEEREAVATALSKVVRGFEEEAKRLLFQAREVEGYALREWPDSDLQARAMIEAHTKLKHIQRRIEAIRDAGRERGRPTEVVDAIIAEVEGIQKDILAVEPQ